MGGPGPSHQTDLLTVRSAYWEVTASNRGDGFDEVKAKIWKSNLHERLKMTLWRIASGIIPTKDTILRFNPDIDPACHYVVNLLKLQSISSSTTKQPDRECNYP
uniref:Reverse transcriptase zinc-binding domain-containing protein n=1 Tax=Quercus lobata TaxID=97700 RepID=A0A7N2M9R0_QUELO